MSTNFKNRLSITLIVLALLLVATIPRGALCKNNEEAVDPIQESRAALLATFKIPRIVKDKSHDDVIRARTQQQQQATIVQGRYNIKLTDGVDPEQFAEQHNLRLVGQVKGLNQVFRFEGDAADIARIDKSLVQYVHEEHVQRMVIKQNTPTDPEFPNQWHLSSNNPFGDINVVPVWEQQVTGDGIIVAVLDNGVNFGNQDLSQSHVPQYSFDYIGNDNDPSPPDREAIHGTAVAGVLGARADNAFCGVGVAYNVRMAGVRIIGDQAIPVSSLAEALARDADAVYIKSNSWGPQGCTEQGCTLSPVGDLIEEAVETASLQGRGGRGTIFVFAAGNEGHFGGDSNLSALTTMKYSIAVAATDIHGNQADYSNTGASLLIAAPGGSQEALIRTIGYDACTDIAGTSFAAPMVSAVTAMMLQVNPNLSWRDVQVILAQTATKNDPNDAGWRDNGAGHHVNHKYGFGLLNTQAAVDLARSFTPTSSQQDAVAFSRDVQSAFDTIPDDDANGISSVIAVEGEFVVDHVTVTVNIPHTARGDLRIYLTSPSGTTAVLANPRRDTSREGYQNWRFMSTFFMGEQAQGEWTINVADLVEHDVGSFRSWNLTLYGSGEASATSAALPNVKTPPSMVLVGLMACIFSLFAAVLA